MSSNEWPYVMNLCLYAMYLFYTQRDRYSNAWKCLYSFFMHAYPPINCNTIFFSLPFHQLNVHIPFAKVCLWYAKLACIEYAVAAIWTIWVSFFHWSRVGVKFKMMDCVDFVHTLKKQDCDCRYNINTFLIIFHKLSSNELLWVEIQ